MLSYEAAKAGQVGCHRGNTHNGALGYRGWFEGGGALHERSAYQECSPTAHSMMGILQGDSLSQTLHSPFETKGL